MSAKEKDIDLIVLNYLKKKGYKQAEAIFRQEAKVVPERTSEQLAFEASLDNDVSVANYITFHGAVDRSPVRYEECYCNLRDWVHASLDRYKVRSNSPPPLCLPQSRKLSC